jgi:copper chaperone CopZ
VIAFALFGVAEMYAQKANAPAKKEQSQAVRGAKLLLEIEGMSCQRGCADGIDAKLKKTAGIVSSRTVFETGRSTVEFDESLIKKEAIVEIIRSMGFKAKELPHTTSKG